MVALRELLLLATLCLGAGLAEPAAGSGPASAGSKQRTAVGSTTASSSYPRRTSAPFGALSVHSGSPSSLRYSGFGQRSPGGGSDSGFSSRSPSSGSHVSSWSSLPRPQIQLKTPLVRPKPKATEAPAAAKKTTACNCDCYSKPPSHLCAADALTKERDTFLNKCHVECINCSMNKRYRVVANVACEDLTK